MHDMRRIVLTAIKLLISATLLYFALRNANLDDLARRMQNLTAVGWIMLAISIALIQVFIAGLRWREISAECDAPLAVGTATRFSLIGSFFNQTLPSAIGGDAIRLLLLARAGAGWRSATYSVFIDRAIGMTAIAIMVVATLPWSYSLIGDPHGRVALLLIDFVALAGGLGFLAFGALQWPWLKTAWPLHHGHACARIATRVVFTRARGPKVVTLSLLVHVLTVAVAWCAARSINAAVNFAQVFQLVPPVMLTTMLPISMAGWGVREAALGLAFGYAGLMANEGVNISILLGAAYFVVGMFGGLVWILGPERTDGMLSIEAPKQV